ncbi:unnamed protein product [Prorocentrum cordatum]|uniref:Uncharacterized protein n=1 Tax=Prorocentrum cordatum TaxID=2364126 RepID=A0ABN9TE01_9DINO|nr:unnamed protein product [Polarella glacialis]
MAEAFLPSRGHRRGEELHSLIGALSTAATTGRGAAAMAPSARGILCLAARVLLSNVAPAAAAGALRRAASAAELRSASEARAGQLRREVALMKARGSEVVDALRSAADCLDRPLRAGGRRATRAPGPATPSAPRAVGPPATNRSAALKQQQEVLQNLLSHLKSSITKDNKEEEDSKRHNEAVIARLRRRLDSDRARLNWTNLSAWDHEMYANDTKLEERELEYWTRGRELQHGMYHANLKMTHGLMSRVKTVMQAYQEVLAKGHLDPAMSELLHAAAQSIAPRAAPKARLPANLTKTAAPHGPLRSADGSRTA